MNSSQANFLPNNEARLSHHEQNTPKKLRCPRGTAGDRVAYIAARVGCQTVKKDLVKVCRGTSLGRNFGAHLFQAKGFRVIGQTSVKGAWDAEQKEQKEGAGGLSVFSHDFVSRSDLLGQEILDRPVPKRLAVLPDNAERH